MTAENRRNLFSAGLTFLFWAILCVAGMFFKPRQKEFKTVQLRLDSPSVTKNIPQEKSASEEHVQKEVMKPAQSEEVQPPLQKEIQKSAPQKSVQQKQPEKSSPKPAEIPKPAKQTLQKSVDEMMRENLSKSSAAEKTQKKEFDWDALAEADGVTSAQNSARSDTQNAQAVFDALEGTAGSAAGQSFSAKSHSENGSVQNAVSANTEKLLETIAETQYTQRSGGVSSTSSIKTAASSDGKIAFEMDNSSVRILLEPKTPEIPLSAKAAATIDSSKNLIITFTVNPDGHVEMNSVDVTPGAAVTLEVKEEIQQAVAKWRFNADKKFATGTFSHKIIKN